MSDKALPVRDRPARRHVRVRCEVRLGGSKLIGSSSNLSESGLYVRVPVAQAQAIRTPAAGDPVTVRFKLPDDTAVLDATGEIVWTRANDVDIGGQPVLGLGLRFMSMSETVTERLKRFVAEFRYTVLIVDDEEHNLDLIRRILRTDYRVITCPSARDAQKILEGEEVAVLVTDQRMPEVTGLEFLRELSERLPFSHVIKIVVTAYPELDQLQEFINIGKIFHYIRKPYDSGQLLQVVRRAVDAYAMAVENERLNRLLERVNERLTRENQYLRRRVTGIEGFDGILGESPEIRSLLKHLERIRQSETTVHIYGETGTGKELVARAIHYGGPRAAGPFVVQNCGGMTETLLQSTLFGHTKGSFTGAARDHVGVFEQAHGGTLFLDEVAELSPSVQASLLRVLQDGEIQPVGASRPRTIDVRILSATHKELKGEVAAGRFREDLFYRLVVLECSLPPLRERRADISVLAHHFLELQSLHAGKQLEGFSPEALAVLERHDWPGNIRELENEVERLVVLCEPGQRIDAGLLSERVRGGSAVTTLPEQTYDEAVRSLERRLVENALAQTDGVVSRAADLLGMERSRLAKLKQRLGL